MFQKGISGNPSGRPKGSPNKDRTNYLDLQIWGSLLLDKASKLPPKQAADIALGVMAILITKINNLPTTPGDSVDNVSQALEMIKDLEEANVAKDVDS